MLLPNIYLFENTMSETFDFSNILIISLNLLLKLRIKKNR